MKFGIRKPSLKKRIAARTSVKRYVRHNLGVKAPRGFGMVTNPKKALYNKVYNKTSISADKFFKVPSAKSSAQNQTGLAVEHTQQSYWKKHSVLTVLLVACFWPYILIYKYVIKKNA